MERGEQEVLLPPGLVYVFQGTKKITVKNEKRSKATGKVRHHEFNIFLARRLRDRVFILYIFLRLKPTNARAGL